MTRKQSLPVNVRGVLTGEGLSEEESAVVTRNGSDSLTTSSSKTGTFTIKAKYLGDPFHKPSSATLKQIVN